jgi:disulfide bond formation protein DsbB
MGSIVTSLAKARLLALLLPAALLAGAWGGQLFGGLFPCEMCHWQRWPHYTALVLALAAFAFKGQSVSRPLVMLAALAILVSGGIGVYHAGVEYGWWQGLTRCSSAIKGGNAADVLNQIMNAPTVRCDEVQWSLFHISLAGWNALFSIGGGLVIMALCLKRR